jgi:hypothetical protein
VEPRDHRIWRVCVGFKSLLNHTGVFESQYANSRKTLKCQNICDVDLRRGSDHRIPCLDWTWMHECVPRASESKRQARVVGPDDIIKSDVDPPECTTCHGSEG